MVSGPYLGALVTVGLMAQVPPAPFGFSESQAQRIRPDTEPHLLAALNRLYADAPSFRTLLEDFTRAEPDISLLFLSTEAKTPGTLVLRPLGQGYQVTLFVQTKLVRLNLDAYEPWLASILFCLREVCRSDRAHLVVGGEYRISPDVLNRSARFQETIRSELKRAPSLPPLRLDAFWPRSYRRHVMGIPDRVRQYRGGDLQATLDPASNN